MFPFTTRSLTKTIDDEIHRAVRKRTPAKYFAFRTADFFSRLGFVVAVLVLCLYVAAYMIARLNHIPEQELAGMVQGFAYVMTGSIALGVIFGLGREILLKELEQVARSLLSRIFADLN